MKNSPNSNTGDDEDYLNLNLEELKKIRRIYNNKS